MSSAVTKIPKPQLRGMLHAQIKWNITRAAVGSVLCTIGAYFAYYRPRRLAVANYKANSDPDAEWERQVKNGFFDSKVADDE